MKRVLFGLQPIAQVARLHKVTHRCMKRRLQKLDLRRRGRVLQRFSGSKGAHLYVDTDELYEVSPALVSAQETDEDNIAAATLRVVKEIRGVVEEIRTDTAPTREIVERFEDALASAR